MHVVWDETKRQRNLAKHGLDFASVTLEFFETATIYPGKSGRQIAVGQWKGHTVIAVVFRRLGSEALSLISMRPASQSEGKEAPMNTKFSSKRPLTDEEEAEVQRMIASDPDNPELTDEQIKQGRPFKEVFPDLYENIQRSRGRPRIEKPRQAITLRVDPDTLARFKAGGKDWRSRMAEVLDAAKP